MTVTLNAGALTALLAADDGNDWLEALASLKGPIRPALLQHVAAMGALGGRGAHLLLGGPVLSESVANRVLERTLRGEEPTAIAEAEGIPIRDVVRHIRDGKKTLPHGMRGKASAMAGKGKGPQKGGNRPSMHWPDDLDERRAVRARITVLRNLGGYGRTIGEAVGINAQAITNWLGGAAENQGVTWPPVNYTLTGEQLLELEAAQAAPAPAPPPAPAPEPVVVDPEPAPAPAPAPAREPAPEPKKLTRERKPSTWPVDEAERRELQTELFRLRNLGVSPRAMATVFDLREKPVQQMLEKHKVARGPYPEVSIRTVDDARALTDHPAALAKPHVGAPRTGGWPTNAVALDRMRAEMSHLRQLGASPFSLSKAYGVKLKAVSSYLDRNKGADPRPTPVQMSPGAVRDLLEANPMP